MSKLVWVTFTDGSQTEPVEAIALGEGRFRATFEIEEISDGTYFWPPRCPECSYFWDDDYDTLYTLPAPNEVWVFTRDKLILDWKIYVHE